MLPRVCSFYLLCCFISSSLKLNCSLQHMWSTVLLYNAPTSDNVGLFLWNDYITTICPQCFWQLTETKRAFEYFRWWARGYMRRQFFMHHVSKPPIILQVTTSSLAPCYLQDGLLQIEFDLKRMLWVLTGREIRGVGNPENDIHSGSPLWG